MTNSLRKLNARDDTEGFDKHAVKHFVISSISFSVALLKDLSDRIIAPHARAVPTNASTFPLSSAL